MATRKKDVRTRRELEMRYGHLYKKFTLFDEEKCFYCGMLKQTQDHVPALSWVGAYGSDYFVQNGYKFLLVPCCSECNNWLGSLKKFTLKERAKHIAYKIGTKYRKFIIAAEWDDDEISEMSRTFQKILMESEAIRITATRRMDYARNVARMLEDGLPLI